MDEDVSASLRESASEKRIRGVLKVIPGVNLKRMLKYRTENQADRCKRKKVSDVQLPLYQNFYKKASIFGREILQLQGKIYIVLHFISATHPRAHLN